MKKILITINNLTIGGSQMSLINILNQLDYKKYQIDLVLYDEIGELLSSIPKEVNVTSIKNKYGLKVSKIKKALIDLFSGEQYFKSLYSKLNNEKKYDIAIAFDGYVSFSDYYAAFSNSKQKLIWVHSDYCARKKMQKLFMLKLILMKNKYKYFDKIVAVSKSAKDSFNKLYSKYKTKTTYIWNLVNIEKINEGKNQKTSIKMNNDTFNIVSIGSIRKVKGFDRLIEVQKKLIANGHNVKIYIIGDGPDRIKLNKLVKRYNLQDRFIFVGKIDNPYNILKQADLFVLSSYYEGFGIVLLESLSCGVPILTPKITGAYDVAKFIAPKNSSIVTENSVWGIYNGIVDVVRNNNYKFKFKFEARKYNKMVMEKLEQLFNDDD
jgi:glycosyltransferase involved in cell wall biosynthesis